MTGVADLRTLPRRTEIPERFGNWRHDAKLKVLFHARYPGYEIDLEKLTTSAKCLDAIMQVTAKTPFSRQDAGDFIEAIRATVNPQANLCSWGRERNKEPGR